MRHGGRGQGTDGGVPGRDGDEGIGGRMATAVRFCMC